MILVESSILMQAQRLPNSEEAKHLASLIVSGQAAVIGPVVMEYLRGARSEEEFEFLTERLAALDFLELDIPTWVWAGRLSGRYMRSGDKMTDLDVVIAATAIRHGVPLYTLDKGFQRIPELELYEYKQAPDN